MCKLTIVISKVYWLRWLYWTELNLLRTSSSSKKNSSTNLRNNHDKGSSSSNITYVPASSAYASVPSIVADNAVVSGAVTDEDTDRPSKNITGTRSNESGSLLQTIVTTLGLRKCPAIPPNLGNWLGWNFVLETIRFNITKHLFCNLRIHRWTHHYQSRSACRSGSKCCGQTRSGRLVSTDRMCDTRTCRHCDTVSWSTRSFGRVLDAYASAVAETANRVWHFCGGTVQRYWSVQSGGPDECGLRGGTEVGCLGLFHLPRCRSVAAGWSKFVHVPGSAETYVGCGG